MKNVKYNIDDHIVSQIEHQVWRQNEKQVYHQVGAQVWSHIENQLCSQIGDQIWLHWNTLLE